MPRDGTTPSSPRSHGAARRLQPISILTFFRIDCVSHGCARKCAKPECHSIQPSTPLIRRPRVAGAIHHWRWRNKDLRRPSTSYDCRWLARWIAACRVGACTRKRHDFQHHTPLRLWYRCPSRADGPHDYLSRLRNDGRVLARRRPRSRYPCTQHSQRFSIVSRPVRLCSGGPPAAVRGRRSRGAGGRPRVEPGRDRPLRVRGLSGRGRPRDRRERGDRRSCVGERERSVRTTFTLPET